MNTTRSSRRTQRLQSLGVVLSLLLNTAATDAIGDFASPWPTQMTRELAGKVVDDSERRERVAEEEIKGWTDTQLSEALSARLVNQTHVFYQPGYGVYVEFNGADGQALMWFQKNPHVVHGTWAVVNKFGKPRACYHYFNSTDYVTHEYEPTECIEPAQDIAAMGVLAVRTGDIFNLRSGKIPYLKGAMDIPALPDPPIAPAR